MGYLAEPSSFFVTLAQADKFFTKHRVDFCHRVRLAGSNVRLEVRLDRDSSGVKNAPQVGSPGITVGKVADATFSPPQTPRNASFSE